MVAVGRPVPLSPRQEQILRRLVLGDTQTQAAAFLGLSCRTVEDALAGARLKYRADSTIALVALWVSTSSRNENAR